MRLCHSLILSQQTAVPGTDTPCRCDVFVIRAQNRGVDEDLVPREFVARTMARHLRLPMGWDDAERQKLIDEAAEQVAARVAELADDWADRTVTEWGRQHWRLPDSETQARLKPDWSEKREPLRW